MFMPILSGLIVSVDALFIGLSLGMQKSCKFSYLVLINTFLFGLCILGFFMAAFVYELIPFDPDLIVGFSFISLGLWTILHFFVSEYIKSRKGTAGEVNVSRNTIILVGLVMSLEATFISMGITLIFLTNATIIIPITVALAHFIYSAFTFYLSRTKHIKRMPAAFNQIISGSALVTYGLMALFIEVGV